MADETTAASAMRKMDAWFQTLSSDEQQIVAGIVNEAFLHAESEHQAAATGSEVSGYLWPLWIPYTPQYAPNLNSALNAPGLAGPSMSQAGAPALSDLSAAQGHG